MIPVAKFFLLLTFFYPEEGWHTEPLFCPTQECVQRVVGYGSPSLRRLRVFNQEPVKGAAGATLTPPIAEYLFN